MIARDNIHLFEEHSSTLPVWWSRRDKPRTVVYLDAHLDLQQTSADSLAALKSCTTLDEVLALEARDHFNLSTRYAYGIENFLYAASQLDLIDRLIWVAPPHVPRQYSPELIEYMQQMDGISFDELTGFRRLGRNALRGKLLGLDITICDYDELEALALGNDYDLDIDIDYFVEVPADRLWIEPVEAVRSILYQLGDPRLVTISRAVSSGFMPLAFRFVGDYLRSFLSSDREDYDYYRQLVEVIGKLAGGNLDTARRELRRQREARPDLAPAYYLLALCSDDPVEKKRLLGAAENRDANYGFDLARETIGLLHRKRRPQEKTLQALYTSYQNSSLANDQRERAGIALAQVMAAAGRIEAAQTLLESLHGDYAGHEDVALAIAARQLSRPDRRESLRALLKLPSDGVKNATIANFYLGELALADRNYDDAIAYFQRAHGRAPAWMLPLERLLECYRLGECKDRIGELERMIEQRQVKLDQLLDAER